MQVRELLAKHDIRPSKGLGQNFLVADWVYDRIIEAAALQPDDIVLEIGPGLGTLTRRIAERCRAVVAVELDRKMVAILSEELVGHTNVHIVASDILNVDALDVMARALGEPVTHFVVVANLPYYITSRVLRRLLGAETRPERLVFMVQREVADRVQQGPGKHSILSLSVQAFADAETICRVPPDAFYPSPKVSSAVLRLATLQEPRVPNALQALFFRTIRAAFQQKRKQIHNSLAANLPLTKEQTLAALEVSGISAQARPQVVSLGAMGCAGQRNL